ncbi:MAG: alanine racemase C-terminal domain-containing protein, partial [Pseudomonadota bacterium]
IAAAAALFPNARTSLPNSAGVVLPFPSDLARPGIALYGGGHDAKRLGLRPVMTVDAPVLSVFGVNAGDATGYGATARFDRPTQLATIAFGYADGLPRSASNSGFAILNHEKARLVGRVSMDLCTVALSGANSLHIGDRAEFWGVNADLEEQAVAAKTLGYELLTGLGPRVERIWTS